MSEWADLKLTLVLIAKENVTLQYFWFDWVLYKCASYFNLKTIYTHLHTYIFAFIFFTACLRYVIFSVYYFSTTIASELEWWSSRPRYREVKLAISSLTMRNA